MVDKNIPRESDRNKSTENNTSSPRSSQATLVLKQSTSKIDESTFNNTPSKLSPIKSYSKYNTLRVSQQ